MAIFMVFYHYNQILVYDLNFD